MSAQIVIEQYPYWYLGLCALVGFIGAFALYYKDKAYSEATTAQKRALIPLALLRVLTISTIAILLLSPLIKRQIIDVVKPYIVLLQDNSESIKVGFKNNEDSVKLKTKLNELTAALAQDYQVATYNFGDKFKKNFAFSYKDKTTNLSEALDELYNIYSNQNVGAIVVATDGIYNQGSNPLYAGETAGIPIYSVALGDTTPKKDLLIERVLHNRIAYLGDKFTVRAELSAKNSKGEKTILSISKGKADGNKMGTKALDIDKADFLHSEEFTLSADAVGLQQYTVSATPITGELTEQNNQQTIYVEIIDSRQKILLLAGAPHPDIAALKDVLEQNRNYQVSTQMADKFTGNIKDFDVVVLHGLPAQNNPAEAILTQLKTNNTPTLFILTAQTSTDAFNRAQNLVQINGATPGNTNDSKAISVGGFNLFTLEGSVGKEVQELPPLITPYGKYSTAANAQTLLKQKIGTVPTDYPLLTFSAPAAASKQAVLCGEGLWRWRIYDFKTDQSFTTTNDLLGKMVQYLAVKNDKRKFRVNLPKTLFNENEQVVIDAELYNDSYELINTPEVNINIYNEAGKAFPFTFNRNGSSYNLNAGFFPPGHYTFQAQTVYNGQEFKANGVFTVASIQLESMQTTANHNLLYALADKTGGGVVSIDSIGGLLNQIRNKESIKPIQYSSFKTEPFINFKWLFALLIVLLSIEWFFRKFLGGY